MNYIIIALLGGCAFGLFVLWMSFQFRYRITGSGLEVTLFGCCVRRIRFNDIKHVTTHLVEGKYEYWANTLLPSRRSLVIIRRSGLRPHFLITPEYRYEFKKHLERLIPHGEEKSFREEKIQSPVAA